MGVIRHQLIFTSLFVLSISLFSQQSKIKVFKADSIVEYPLFYKNTDSIGLNQLLAYYAIDTNQLAFEKKYYFGKQSGAYRSYFPSGQLMELIIYQNGKRNGDYTRYDEQGNIVIKAKYKNDLLHGFWINRMKKIQGRYRNGLKQGKWEYNLKTAGYIKRYYDQGQLTDQASFLRKVRLFSGENKKEVPVDTLKVTPSKETTEQAVFEDTMVINDRGKISVYEIEQVPRDSILHPSMYKAVFTDDRNQTAIVKYIYNGYTNGLFQKFYPNGNIYQYSSYSFGKLNGKWKQYSEEGVLSIKGNYKNGKKQGVWHYDIGHKNYRKEKFRDGEKIR